MAINIKDIQPGDIFSEASHYTAVEVKPESITFIQRETGKKVELSTKYVESLLTTADQFTDTIEVTKEDKRDGTPGIRTIFHNISTSKVFTVKFKKKDTPKTKKALAEEKAAQIATAADLIEKAHKSKKSMAAAYTEALKYVQDNPIQDFIPGEERVLRGYKVDFESRDGKYNCVDMDIVVTEKESGLRPVNINTISELIVDGHHYIVK